MSAAAAAPDYRLPDAEAQRIFDEQILPTLTGTPREHPRVVFIAGQPGAGKTTVQNAFMAQLGAEDAVPLDGDDLLTYHPQYRALALAEDLTASLLVDHDAGQWWRMAVEHIKAQRLDVVISAPLGGAEWAGKQMRAFRDAGYLVGVAFMAVHEAQSLIGVVDRYQRAREAAGFGRWVVPHALERIYPGVLDTADLVDREHLADAVHVVRRGGDVVYNNRLVNGEWEHPPRTREAIEAERALPWTLQEQARFRDLAAALMPRIRDEVKPVLAAAISRGLAHLQTVGVTPAGDRGASATSADPRHTAATTSSASGPPWRHLGRDTSNRGSAR